MSPETTLGIFGGDQRQVFLAQAFLKKGFHVFTYRTVEPILHDNCTVLHSLKELIEQCNVIIGPIPLTRDLVSVASATTADSDASGFSELLTKNNILIGGGIPPRIAEACASRDIPFYDYMKDEKVAILNAIATAEGSIMEAIRSSDINLHGSTCLVLGYGRCGKVLAGKLKALDARVIIAARSEEALAYAEASGYQTTTLVNMKKILPSCQFIFNTIPALILDKSNLSYVNPKVTIIDIASQPGGVDYEYALKHGLNAKLCLGLPGKVSPRSSADIILTGIVAFMKERSD